jgi:Uma2 family endonuclease
MISEEEYLKGELLSEVKHEYVAGRVYAMSGGSVNHSAVARNFLLAIGSSLRGGCQSFTSDLSVRIEQVFGVTYFYPDASVVCAPIDGSAQFTTEPAVILEVLSPSTRRVDETSKLQGYLTLTSLQVCLLAESDRPLVTVYRRQSDHFAVEVYEGRDAVIPLDEIETSLFLADLYDGVK